MRSFLTFLAAVAPGLVSAYTIDPELGDGVFFVPQNPPSARLGRRGDVASSFGQPIKLMGADAADQDVPTATAPTKRQAYTPLPNVEENHKCIPHNVLDLASVNNAKANLKTYCQKSQIPAAANSVGGVLYSKYGSALWYSCTWTGAQSCWAEEIDWSDNWLDGKCGKLKAGNLYAKDWAKGYGRGAYQSVVCDQIVE